MQDGRFMLKKLHKIFVVEILIHKPNRKKIFRLYVLCINKWPEKLLYIYEKNQKIANHKMLGFVQELYY